MEHDVCIPDNDPVRLISQFVEEMDLTALYSTYERLPSKKYASPEIMLKIMLYALGQVTVTEVFIDGTKIEASANKYTFVWKKAVTKHQARFLQKTALLVGDIVERYEFKSL